MKQPKTKNTNKCYSQILKKVANSTLEIRLLLLQSSSHIVKIEKIGPLNLYRNCSQTFN